jgi:hypothetical protein
MESTQSHTTRNLIVALALLAVVFIGCCSCAAATFAITRVVGDARAWTGFERKGLSFGIPLHVEDRVTVEREFGETFKVGDAVHLVVDLSVGQVRIEGTDREAVAISGRIRASGPDDADAQSDLDRVQVDLSQEGKTVRVEDTVDQPAGGWRNSSPEVLVTIQVPRDTSIDLDVDVGDVRVEGTAADADIQTDVARVVLADVSPSEHLSVKSEVGAIEFDGDLAAGASYEFGSNVGAIQIRLPRDSRFELDASSGIGAVIVDFEVDGARSGLPVSRSVKGSVNGGGNTKVTAQSDVGAIAIQSR